ncbi:MAG: hypothetical protein ABL871_03815 [Terricaulis sp.]
MKIKAFAAILHELCDLMTEERSAEVARLVADLKPFARSELKGFFTLSSPSAIDPAANGAMTVKQLANAMSSASKLLKAGGAGVKGRELQAAANDLNRHGDVPVHELIDRVRAAQEQARQEAIAGLAARLLASQADREKFDVVVAELSKSAPDVANAVAVAYVQGKAKYASKPKALEAIRDKQYERARLANKMGDS